MAGDKNGKLDDGVSVISLDTYPLSRNSVCSALDDS